MGPKRRQMAAPAAPLFDKSEWFRFLVQKGPQGVSATLCSEGDVCPNIEVPVSSRDLYNGRVSAWRTQRELRYSKLRKTPPPWSFPAAVWRMLLEPGRGMRRKRQGLGASDVQVPNSKVRTGFHMLHASMQASPQSTMLARDQCLYHRKEECQKRTRGFARLLHSLESLGKAYYAQVWKCVPATYKRHHASGHLPCRRREQTILQQCLLRHRLRQVGKAVLPTSRPSMTSRMLSL